MGLFKIVKRITPILARLRFMLSDHDNSNGSRSKYFSMNATRSPLLSLYEKIKLERISFLDRAVWLLHKMENCFRVLKSLDYQRSLFFRRKIEDCVKTLKAILKDSNKSYETSKPKPRAKEINVQSEYIMNPNATAIDPSQTSENLLAQIRMFQDLQKTPWSNRMDIETFERTGDKTDFKKIKY